MSMVSLDEKAAREEFLRRNEQISSRDGKADQKRLNQAKRRMVELDKLISSVHEDKVLGKIPEDVCVGLLQKVSG